MPSSLLDPHPLCSLPLSFPSHRYPLPCLLLWFSFITTDSIFSFNEILMYSPTRAVQTFILSLNYVQATVELLLSQDDLLYASSRKAVNVPSNFMGLLLLLTFILEARESYMISLMTQSPHEIAQDINIH